MDFFTYGIISTVIIMVIHFAIGIKKEFNLFLMIACFAIGGAVGFFFKSYEIGFILSLVLSLFLW
jgi:hypothetical protein